jgi:hypothetical protein
MGQGFRRLVVLSFALLALAPAAAQADSLELLGKSNLGGGGLNGQVATVGNIAVVGSGILGGAGARTSYYASYPCPPTTVKIVDVSDPSAPAVKSEIPIQPLAVPNDVDALRVTTPTFNGVLLAVALVRCQPSAAGNATERGVAYYDITNPSNPVFLSRFNPDENFFKPTDPACSLADSTRCASSNDNVSLVQRADGKVLSLSTEPASSTSQGLITSPPSSPSIIVAGCQGAGTGTGCSYRGDVRIVDVTNPTTPTYVGSFPNHSGLNGGVEQRPEGYTPPGGVPQRLTFSNNGCRNYQYGLSVGVQNGNRALVPFLDAGLYTVDITNPAAPATLGRWQYATDRALEGNAAYVDFVRSGGRDLALIGENDWTGVTSALRIDGASAVAGSKFACEAMPTLFDPQNTAQVYRHANSQIPGGIVYVGRGCPGDVPPGSPVIAGKIAFRDLARQPDREPAAGTNCSATAAALNLQTLGATGVVVGNTSLTTVSPQAISAEGDHSVGPADITIPIYMIDTPDANAIRNALCPPPVAPATGCAAGGITLSGAMVDSKGEWGNLRVVDVTNPGAPTLRGTYRPPAAQVFPPPDLGVYAVHHAVGGSGSTAFVAGHSNGVRAIDLSTPDPTEIASFVPPDTVDPTASIPAKANVVGIDVAENGSVVASDMNSGLYVLRLKPTPTPPAPPPPPAPIAAPPPPPVPGNYILPRKGSLSATVTPSRDLRAPFVFRVRGRLSRPSGITRAQGCSGKVRVRVLRAKKAIATII